MDEWSGTADGTVTEDGGRRRVHFERRYAAPIERVWDALTSPERLARWLTASKVQPGVGGRVEHDFGDEGVCGGEILQWQPPHLLEYQWHFPGEAESVVRFTLEADGPDATRLVLDHRRLDPAQGAGYGAGWHAHLDVLAAEVEGTPAPSWDERFAMVLPRYRP
ncbi:MAG TPA: SRPBCC family protein [Egicoccus sp.]|nr:SRPBCC family protein [Egicoccus sp.]HSK24373.1 SRPBCC family protein [Egicoccus sp.]